MGGKIEYDFNSSNLFIHGKICSLHIPIFLSLWYLNSVARNNNNKGRKSTLKSEEHIK